LAGGTIFIEHLDERWLSVDILPGEAIANGKREFILLLRADPANSVW
jgi:DnaJ family protein A protein 2